MLIFGLGLSIFVSDENNYWFLEGFESSEDEVLGMKDGFLDVSLLF